ncbi:MAG: hypothetical protein PGN33_21090 [Methylobacterium radiotolerans]
MPRSCRARGCSWATVPVSCASSAAPAATATEDGSLWAGVPGANRIRGPAFLWQGSGSLRARFAPEGDAAAVFDERGRLIVFETVTGQVTLRLI